MKKFDGIIYAHNGGKFDFLYLFDEIGPQNCRSCRGDKPGEPMMINSRIAAFKFGLAEFRDSWLLVPTPLAAFNKTEIDYEKFKTANRDKHKKEIIRYLKDDLKDLFNYVVAMISRHGNGLTIAGRTFAILKERFGLTPVRTNETYDANFRRFYYGGRCQFFKLGEIPFKTKYVDINSAYPNAMQSQHPFGSDFSFRSTYPKKTDVFERSFFKVIAESDDALPFRNPKTKAIEYGQRTGEFFATGWEIQAGLDTGKLKLKKLLGCYTFRKTENFSAYVNHFYNDRLDAKACGDNTRSLIDKLVMNSLYGRFALNPREFRDVRIVDYDEPETDGWDCLVEFEEKGYKILGKKRPVFGNAFFNVATAASITGHVRAFMLRSLNSVTDPVYCDTDSIICRETGNLKLGKNLGQWDLESEFTQLFVAGKKLYAGQTKKGDWKTASKGVRLSHQEIIRVSKGEEVEFSFDAPNLSLLSNIRFTKRRVNRDDLRSRNKNVRKIIK